MRFDASFTVVQPRRVVHGALRRPVPAAGLMLAALAILAAGCRGEPHDAAWCSNDTVESAPPAERLTFWRDIKPITDQKCGGCHASGAHAPFTFDTWEEVQPWASAIRTSVEAGTMPPFQAHRCCATYTQDYSLTDAERAALVAWVDQGAPEGDPAEHGEERSPIGGLSRVDLTLAMSEPYVPVPDPGTVDVVRCFLLDWPETRRRYVTGMLPEPGNRAIVHHLLLSIGDASQRTDLQQLDAADAAPGFDCSGGLPNLTPVGGSLYGGDYPRGLGTAVDPGAAMVLQVHYAVTDRLTGPDLTRVHFRLEDEAEEVRSSIVQNPMWLAGPGMSIPAGDPDAAFWFDYRPTLFTGGKPVHLQSVVPHAHRYARRIRMLALHADGTETCLLEIPDWEFGWEQPYWFAEPIAFAPDDRFYSECRFDNFAANQPDGAAPRDIAWGDNDQDMCAGFVSFTVDTP